MIVTSATKQRTSGHDSFVSGWQRQEQLSGKSEFGRGEKKRRFFTPDKINGHEQIRWKQSVTQTNETEFP